MSGSARPISTPRRHEDQREATTPTTMSGVVGSPARRIRSASKTQ